MKFKAENPSSFETVATFDLTSKSRQYARLGFPIFASAKGKTYAFLIEGTPGLYEVGVGLKRLQVFPPGYDSFPDLAEKITEITIPQIYASFERAQMPVALYGKGDFLYLLLRGPGDAGSGTIWRLAKIDPSKEAVIHIVKLPISGEHVMLVPGERRWAALEKGPVEGLGRQKVISIALIPASWPEEGIWERASPSVGSKGVAAKLTG